MICDIGRTVFSFEGELQIAKLIAREFPGKSRHTGDDLHVGIIPVSDLKNNKGDISKDESGRFYNTGYSVTFPKDNSMKIAVDKEILSGGFIEKVARVKDWNYLTPKEIVAKNLIYDILEPVAHERAVSDGLGFIHASAIAKDEDCFLFTGAGGMGKTALCLISSEKGYEYLNDDLSLVDSKGTCFHHPKWLQIYGYNIKNSQALKQRFFSGRGILDRFQFNTRNTVFGPKRVRRRVPPVNLFDKIRKSARITRVFFLSPGSELDIQNMDKKEFVESGLAIIQKEFSDYVNGFSCLDAGPLDSMLNETKKLYSALYDASQCLEVTVPPSQDLKKLFLKIESHAISTS